MKYEPPSFVTTSPQAYQRWLSRKAATHARRDRKRGNTTATIESYKAAIHGAVVASGGSDAYTGLPLDWSLIGTYDNAKSSAGRRVYKKSLADLPTVDHVGDGLGPAEFRICSFRINDAKHDLSEDEFIDVCRRVLAWRDRG